MNTRDKLFPGRIRFSDIKNNRYISRKPIYDFCAKNQDKITGRCLDFGCGSMQYEEVFVEANTIGLDVESASSFFGNNSRVVYYDGYDIPFEDSSFDSVYCIQTLCCIADYEHSLSEIFRILKNGGILLITVPFAFPELRELSDYNRFSEDGIRNALESAGFELVTLEGSTATKDTLRRLKIAFLQHEKNAPLLVWKSYTIYANLCFALSKRKWNHGCLPIDYMVLCRKRG